MKRSLLAAAVAALALGSAGAFAKASAELTVNGISRTLTSSDGELAFLDIVYFGLNPGETKTFTYNWSIDLKDDGFEVGSYRTWSYTPPTWDGPDFNGKEQAAASLDIVLPKEADSTNYQIGITYLGSLPQFTSTPDEELRESGTFTVVATDLSTFETQTGGHFTMFGSVFLDASALPEPSPLLLAVGGLVLMCRGVRVRATARS